MNLLKYKVSTLSLRRKLIVGTYAIYRVALERVPVMEDLGVFIDEKLISADHVESTVRKAAVQAVVPYRKRRAIVARL